MILEPWVLLVFLLSVSIGYFVRRPVYLSSVDPLQFGALGEGIWVVTVYQLAAQGIASSEQATVFGVCLILWWAMWWRLAKRWGPGYRVAMAAFWLRIATMPRQQSLKLTLLYLAGLMLLLVVTLLSGGGGDNRLSIMKLLRPVESVTTLLVPIVLFRFLIAQGCGQKIMLVLILSAMVVTGGKSSVLLLLIPVTGAVLIGRMSIRGSTIAGLCAIGLIGFAASVAINYGVTDLLEVITIFYTRLSLDGDVYLLALPNELVANLSTTSLASYLLGPFIKLLFLPIHVDISIGSQIASVLQDGESVNGPNPHWPIVLLAYHRSVFSALWLSVVCFAMVLWVKLRLPSRSTCRRWPIWLAIPMNSYILLYPQSFFADPSFPTIYLAQALVLAGALSVILRPAFCRPRRIARPARVATGKWAGQAPAGQAG